MSLSPNLDDDTKRMTLRNIAQCIYLNEFEASGCTNEDIKLLASFLDDRDKETKTETLNAFKAFATIWKFKIKIQEYIPKIIEIVTSNWDNNLQYAGLQLLNALHIPDHTHTLLTTWLTNFMDILLTANTSTKVQVLKFLGTLIEKEDLLYNIMNCQAPADFLNLFQTSQPGNLLYEMLVFVERLSEGRQSPQYQSMQWDYNKNSLHEIIFGDNSRLSERLLALIVHPEEDVQTQACKVILSLKINKEESRISSVHTLESELNAYPLESTRKSQIANASLISQPLISTTESSSKAPHSESGVSFHSLPDTSEIHRGSFHPSPGTNETSVASFHSLPDTNEISHGSIHPLLGTNETSRGSFHPPPGINDTSVASFHSLPDASEISHGSFHPLLGTNETSHGSFHPPPGINDTSVASFHSLPDASEISHGSFHPLLGTNETSHGSFHPPPGTNETSHGSFHPLLGTNETSHGSFHPPPGTNETTHGSFHLPPGTNETSIGSFHPLLGTNETGQSFHSLERADHSFHPLPNVTVESSSERVLEEPMDSFHAPPVAGSEESDNSI